jgi:NAD(P)-dependent dehydrogenase (short-subunit alcohol dehydrogenase family)
MIAQSFTDYPVVVVTGGARGIGLAVGEWFLNHHYKVALLDNNQTTLDEAIIRIGKPELVIGIHCDISNIHDVERAAQKVISTFGHVDALVNNAGVAIFKPVLETSFEEFRTVLGTNLDGTFICSQIFGDLMVKNGGGSIVNVASISGLRASTLRVAYGTSKAAIIHLTKQYAVELGNYNVRVNAIAPGLFLTDRLAVMFAALPEADRSEVIDLIVLKRMPEIRECVDPILFLASEQSSYITGAVLDVNGGRLMAN